LKKHVLFVDDEPKVLAGLQRMLRGLRHEWEMTFVESGAEALAHLAQAPCDVVVTDMRMPGMDGSQLLREVMCRHPGTVRIVLSGQCDRQSVLKAVGPTHQFLTKPCDSDVIKSTVARACRLRDQVADEWVRQAVAGVQALATSNIMRQGLNEAIQGGAPTVEELGQIVSSDVAMSAKVLQLVNSGFFGSPQRIVDPTHAVRLLGPETVRDLATACDGLCACKVGPEHDDGLEPFLAHSRAVAHAARRIAESQTDDRRVVEASWVAGLLHDVGILVLCGDQPRQYIELRDEARRQNVTLRETERRTFHTTRDDVGAYLLGLWGLPDVIVTAVGKHLEPGEAGGEGFGPVTAVHVANALVEAGQEPSEDASEPLDLVYLERIGCGGKRDLWQGLCREFEPEGVSG